MLLLALVGLLVFVSVVVRIADWNAARFPAGDADVEPVPSPVSRAWAAHRTRRTARRTPPAPELPEGHRPPAGLSPLSPSERFLRSESARGIRALQLWLLDQDAASA